MEQWTTSKRSATEWRKKEWIMNNKSEKIGGRKGSRWNSKMEEKGREEHKDRNAEAEGSVRALAGVSTSNKISLNES